jgi:hypothetical protein
MRRALSSPILHGTHLPQDSEWVNSTKWRATSVMAPFDRYGAGISQIVKDYECSCEVQNSLNDQSFQTEITMMLVPEPLLKLNDGGRRS